MKIVINKCYGGFSLSDEAMLKYAELKGIAVYPKYNAWGTLFYLNDQDILNENDFPRDDPTLVQIVETLDASGRYSRLKVVDIPDDVKWEIVEYDGIEHIAEVHRKWE